MNIKCRFPFLQRQKVACLSYVHQLTLKGGRKRPSPAMPTFADDDDNDILAVFTKMSKIQAPEPTIADIPQLQKPEPTIVAKIPPLDFSIIHEIPRDALVNVLEFLGTDHCGHLVVSWKLSTSGNIVGGLKFWKEFKDWPKKETARRRYKPYYSRDTQIITQKRFH